MDIEFSGNPKPFGIIGLVLAIFSLLFSLIPCVGFYAIIPAIIAVIFSGIALLYLKQQRENSSIPLAGVIIGLVAIVIGAVQYYKYKTVYDAKAEIDNSLNDIEHEIEEGLKQAIWESIQNENSGDSAEQITTDSIPTE